MTTETKEPIEKNKEQEQKHFFEKDQSAGLLEPPKTNFGQHHILRLNGENRLELPQVQLIAIDGRRQQAAINSIKINFSLVNFGLVTFIGRDRWTMDDKSYPRKDSLPLNSRQDYSRFVLTKLADYIYRPWILIVQWDSQIINPCQWDNDYLLYDYIGGLFHKKTAKVSCVGNGGFSLRTYHFMDRLREINWNNNYSMEDMMICSDRRLQLEREGFKFAPWQLAEKFCCTYQSWQTSDSFGYHGFGKNDPYQIREIQENDLPIEIVEDTTIPQNLIYLDYSQNYN